MNTISLCVGAVIAACSLMAAGAALAQGADGRRLDDALAALKPSDRADVTDLLATCDTHLVRLVQLEIGRPNWGRTSQDAIHDYYAASYAKAFSGYSSWDVSALDSTIVFTRNGMNQGMGPRDEAGIQITLCIQEARIAQLKARGSTSAAATTTTSATPAPTIPTASDPVTLPAEDVQKFLRDWEREDQLKKLGEPTYKALDDLFKPGAPPATSPRPPIDYSLLYQGKPATDQARQDLAAGQQAYDQSKQRKMHNRLNDATACLKVEPTGARQEWGIEGRYRLVNTCGYPVEASWCANKTECDTGRGNLWTIPPNNNWPIFFAGAGGPLDIKVGGCKAGDAKQPLPSDAEIAQAGGINESHQQPTPYPGVSVMPSHRCE